LYDTGDVMKDQDDAFTITIYIVLVVFMLAIVTDWVGTWLS